MSAKVHDIKVPDTQEVCEVLKNGLKSHFHKVSVEIVDCPDLTKEPFKLAAPGICGKTYVADVGGFDYLLPTPVLDKKYDLANVVDNCHLSDGFIIGAGAGPYHEAGINCELVANMTKRNNGTYIARVCGHVTTAGQHPPPPHELIPAKSPAFTLLGQFLVSSGQPGKVIHVKASDRSEKITSVDMGEKTAFSSLLQAAMGARYSKESVPVGLGGVFIIRGAKVKMHVMPEFSTEPLCSPAAVNQWLCYYDVDPPVICVGELVSHDPQNWGIRNQHFHGFNAQRTAGGHYHYEVQEEGSTVEYEGYFVLAERLLRQDQPPPKL